MTVRVSLPNTMITAWKASANTPTTSTACCAVIIDFLVQTITRISRFDGELELLQITTKFLELPSVLDEVDTPVRYDAWMIEIWVSEHLFSWFSDLLEVCLFAIADLADEPDILLLGDSAQLIQIDQIEELFDLVGFCFCGFCE